MKNGGGNRPHPTRWPACQSLTRAQVGDTSFLEKSGTDNEPDTGDGGGDGGDDNQDDEDEDDDEEEETDPPAVAFCKKRQMPGYAICVAESEFKAKLSTDRTGGTRAGRAGRAGKTKLKMPKLLMKCLDGKKSSLEGSDGAPYCVETEEE